MASRAFQRVGRALSPLSLWLFFGTAYFVLQLGLFRREVPSVVDDHLTDVLCLPLVLGVALAIQRQKTGEPEGRLPRWHGFSSVIIYAVYFEGILPRWDARATADIWDCASYFLGWVLFEWAINRRSN